MCRRSEMKQRKKITRVLNMQNLKQKRQKVNHQMNRQRNTDNEKPAPDEGYHKHNADQN
jgi:hypothetical protein